MDKPLKEKTEAELAAMLRQYDRQIASTLGQIWSKIGKTKKDSPGAERNFAKKGE